MSPAIPTTPASLVNEYQEGKIKNTLESNGGGDVGQALGSWNSSLLTQARCGEVQGDPKVELAQEMNRYDGQPKQAHLTWFTQDTDLFLP